MKLKPELTNMLKEYIDRLSTHDWTYMYSDDYRYYDEGYRQKQSLTNLRSVLLSEGVPAELLDGLISLYSPFHGENQEDVA
ncbi:MAG: hypothetical protein D6698_12095 [Gammaproteobacteria bacterium]|nr:MAG: hypothetical protein D6698_12095 [Gammaproteobacteria bacterium]